MAIVTNKYKRALGLPSGQVLQPGIPTAVSDWTAVGANHLVRQWLAGGILSVADAGPAPLPVVPEPDPDAAVIVAEQESPTVTVVTAADEQLQLIEKLAAIGIHKDRRTKVDTLRRLLAESGG